MTTPLPADHAEPHPEHRRLRRRVVWLLFGVAAAAVMLALDPVYDAIGRTLDWAQPHIAAHPVGGAVLFVVLSAVSAMLAFFSSAALIPVAVHAFGTWPTAALLWCGWMLGGAAAYSAGRFLGRPLIGALHVTAAVDHWRERLPARAGFPLALLVQSALPSEIPGYLFGTIRLNFGAYFAALALVDAPYALMLVWLGDSVVERDFVVLVAIGVTIVAWSAIALLLLGRRLRRPTADAASSSR